MTNGNGGRYHRLEVRKEVDVSVKWREKNISHPLAFFDLGQSDWINYELRILNYELQKK
ncbi:MAG: hypothetical protein ACI9JY_002098 [Saprospiraceae bacterium]|jgi:hypothetical protein